MRMADRMYDLDNQFEQLKKKNTELEKETAELKEINSETLTQLNLDNGELIIENEKLRKENAELRNNGFTVSAMTEQQLKVALEKGEQLEKENAEWEKFVKDIQNRNEENYLKICHKLATELNRGIKLTEQLTKAKEIIGMFVEWANWEGVNCPNFQDIQSKAEQFLEKVKE